MTERDRNVLREELISQAIAVLPLVLLLAASSPKLRLWWQLKMAALNRTADNMDAADRIAMRQLRRDLSAIANADLRNELELERWGDLA